MIDRIFTPLRFCVVALCLVVPISLAHAAVTVIGFWELEDAYGSSVAVDSASGYNGIMRGDVLFGVKGVSAGTFAGEFDGVDDYIEIPHDDAFLIDEGSIALWFRAGDMPTRMDILSKDSSGYDTGGHLSIWVDSLATVNVRLQSASSDAYLQTGAVVTEAIWHHLAFVWGTGGMELYIDGVLLDTDPYAGGLGTTSGGIGNYEPLVIGGGTYSSGNLSATPTNDLFTGTIDEVSLFSGRLDGPTIASLAGITVQGYLFTDISVASGFDVNLGTGMNGIHWGDLDGDGDLDAILTGSSSNLLWNDAAGGFFVNASMGNMPRQGAIGDYDNDGDLDFWHINLAYWENNGAGGLTNQGAVGMPSPYNNENVAAIDVDADGLLDVVMLSQNGNWIGYNNDPGDPNLPAASFAESIDGADGLHVSGAYGNGDYVSTADVNNDGYLDIFYHYNSGELFLSNGDGTFTLNSSGISVVTGNTDKMGSAWGDYDNDGDMDLWVSRYDSSQPGTLWRNDGGVFTEVGVTLGITNDDHQRGCAWGDYDNDGDLDLAIARVEGKGVIVYENLNGVFTRSYDFPEVTGDTVDVCFVDVNNDGNLELIVVRESGAAAILRNDIGSDSYLRVRFVGTNGVNAAGVGVRLELWDSTNTVFYARREIGTARGYAGQNPLWVHFGGIEATGSYTLRVYNPGSTKPHNHTVTPSATNTVFASQTVAQLYTLNETGSNVRVIRWNEVGAQR
jgi:concanavalin A-like lectin/glucanase superfamily protein/VCBS repeat protein